MNRFVPYLFAAALLAGPVFPQASGNTSKNANAAAKKPKSFIDRVLEFLSISDTPGAMKGPAPDIANGQIWVADLRSGSRHELTGVGNYHSPVFLPGGADVMALRGNDVVRIPSSGGEGMKLYSVERIVKLVGVGSQDPGKMLVLLRNETGDHPRVALLAIDTGSITDLPYDPGSTQDLQMVEALEGWSHTYGDRRIYVRRQTKESIAGTTEWSDVFLLANGQQPVDVSRCDGLNCGQPSLSQDGNLLVYIKEKSD